ncbi:MAG: long-chain fatty acid--CoA ligase [Alphaproteobacteria bacterium]|nr:long-chain fatty acid--CoA ligase [Alphaproteobacteria bacterium]
MRAATPPGLTVDRFFNHPATRLPDKVALIDDGGEATFGEIDRRANRLARALLAAGARRGDRVAIILPNTIAFIVAEIALLRVGMVKAPLNIRFAVDEVMYALADCAPAVVVATAEYAQRIVARRGEIASLRAILSVGGEVAGDASFERAAGEGDASPLEPARFADDDPLLIRYTGGTTGRPKGIVHTHRSYLAIVQDVMRENALVESDVTLQLGHLSHGLNFMWPAYYATGGTQVLRERFDPLGVWRDFERFKITWVYMVPTMIHMLLEADDGRVDVSSLRSFCYASAPMPVPLLRRAIRRFGNIFTQVYTLSESPVITTMMRPEEHLEIDSELGPRLGSVGREVVTMELRLVDEDMRDVAPGEAGEVAVRSVNNMACYWNLPAETARTLVDGWVRTGDVGRRARDGFLYLVDRKKDIIITGGFNVWPKEVENVLLRHDGVDQCAVVGAPDEIWGERIVAFVVRRAGAAVSADALIDLCRERLADYKKPREIRFVDRLPLTPVGKISRLALRQKLRAERSES